MTDGVKSVESQSRPIRRDFEADDPAIYEFKWKRIGIGPKCLVAKLAMLWTTRKKKNSSRLMNFISISHDG